MESIRFIMNYENCSLKCKHICPKPLEDKHFGPRGAANLLFRITTIYTVLFMATSLGFWIISASGEQSALRGEEAPVTEAPAVAGTKQKDAAEKPSAPEIKQEKEQAGPKTEKKAPEKKD